jgi:mono/diheme cytochrome c family protein
MKKLLRLLVLLLAAMMVLSACGGGESETNEPAAGEENGEADEAEESAAGDVAAGQTLFDGTCVSCHGPGGTGLPGLGKDLTTSEFIADQTDAQLVEFLKVGRPASDPANTTGVDMPPKGGNPALDDQDIVDIVAYLRSIHQ